MPYMHVYEFARQEGKPPRVSRDGEPFIVSAGDRHYAATRLGTVDWGSMKPESIALAYWLLREFFRHDLAREHAEGFCFDVIAREQNDVFQLHSWEIVAYVLARLTR